MTNKVNINLVNEIFKTITEIEKEEEDDLNSRTDITFEEKEEDESCEEE